MHMTFEERHSKAVQRPAEQASSGMVAPRPVQLFTRQFGIPHFGGATELETAPQLQQSFKSLQSKASLHSGAAGTPLPVLDDEALPVLDALEVLPVVVPLATAPPEPPAPDGAPVPEEPPEPLVEDALLVGPETVESSLEHAMNEDVAINVRPARSEALRSESMVQVCPDRAVPR